MLLYGGIASGKGVVCDRFVGCLFRRVLEQVQWGRGLDGESIIDDGGEVDAAVAAIDVLRSCCWAGIGLLGAVTGVGWELGVPCRAPPLSDTQCVSVATQPCAVDRRVVWLLAAPAMFGVPPCRPIISGGVLAPESARRRWCAGLGEERQLAIRAERRLPCIISGMRGVGAWAFSAAVPPCRPSSGPWSSGDRAGPCSWQQECLNGSAHVRMLAESLRNSPHSSEWQKSLALSVMPLFLS